MLFLIGLGLGDEKDITVKGLEAVRSCNRVFLEAYTSVLGVSRAKLEAYYGRPIEVADREFIESDADKSIIAEAGKSNIAVLVVGDPFGATTHTDLAMRAKKAGVPVKVIHNASIMNAMGCSGLQLYHFGQAVTIVFFTETWRPDSFYDKIQSNRRAGLHTLCLLDIKMKEISETNLARGKKIYEPPRFLTINQAVEELLEVEDRRKEKAYTRETYCVGLARVGQEDQRIVSGPMGELLDVDFGSPLHSLIISGEMHFLEKEHADCFLVKPSDKRTTPAAATPQPAHP